MRNNFLYETSRNFLKVYARMMLRLDIRKHADLPSAPALFVANHPSATDPFLLHLLSRPMSVLIVSSAFDFPIFGAYLRAAGQIAVSPGGDALEQAVSVLQAGNSVGIFPEGTFSPAKGHLGIPHSGAARIALSTGVQVVPVGIHLPWERRIRIASRMTGRQTVGYWYLSGAYAMTTGQPVQFEGDPNDRGQVQSVTRAIMELIAPLVLESEYRLQQV